MTFNAFVRLSCCRVSGHHVTSQDEMGCNQAAEEQPALFNVRVSKHLYVCGHALFINIFSFRYSLWGFCCLFKSSMHASARLAKVSWSSAPFFFLTNTSNTATGMSSRLRFTKGQRTQRGREGGLKVFQTHRRISETKYVRLSEGASCICSSVARTLYQG